MLFLTTIELIIFSTVLYIHIISCPYNKVEESFNTQAVFDVINKFPSHLPDENKSGHTLNQTSLRKVDDVWDHKLFPGVVPRTFVGSLVIGLLTKSVYSSSASDTNQYSTAIVSRLVLALLFVFSILYCNHAIQKRFGPRARIFFSLITISQFHYLFYASRLLPNTFAAILSNIVFAFWICRKFTAAIVFVAFTVVIFRFDTSLLFGWFILDFLFVRKTLSFKKLFTIGIPAGILALIITLSIDSFFWGRLVWPEFESIYFNIWLNKSHEWGTQPYFWYMYSCIPRLLLSSLPLLFMAEKRLRREFLYPTIAYILTYSLLPHKELRFILFALPLLNLCSASGLDKLYKRSNNHKNIARSLFIVIILFSIIAINTFSTLLFNTVSKINYPGGEVAMHLNEDIFKEVLEDNKHSCAFINNLASQTGFSNFLIPKNLSFTKSDQSLHELIKKCDLTYLIFEPRELKKICLDNGENEDCLFFKKFSKVCTVIRDIYSFAGFNTGKMSITRLLTFNLDHLKANLIKKKLSLRLLKCSLET